MKKIYPFTTQAIVRKSFWITHPDYVKRGRQTQNAYPVEVRMAFCDYVERLQRQGRISPALAQRATL